MRNSSTPESRDRGRWRGRAGESRRPCADAPAAPRSRGRAQKGVKREVRALRENFPRTRLPPAPAGPCCHCAGLALAREGPREGPLSLPGLPEAFLFILSNLPLQVAALRPRCRLLPPPSPGHRGRGSSAHGEMGGCIGLLRSKAGQVGSSLTQKELVVSPFSPRPRAQLKFVAVREIVVVAFHITFS